MFKLFKCSFKEPKKAKVKIVKGKDGKKGLKINGKLVLAVEYDRIDVRGNYVYFEQYGVIRMASIEGLLEPPGPCSVSGPVVK